MAAIDVPTLQKARQAGEALATAGAGQVWLFGSLARGEVHPHSDIDLIAVFDDVDYRNRRRIETDLRRKASATAGRPVDVMVTDRAEWKIQRQIPASFVTAIEEDLTLLADRPAAVAVQWDKEQVMATSNEQLSAQRIGDVVGQLAKILGGLDPTPRELSASDPGERDWLVGGRLIGLCEAAHLVVEASLKAVGTLTGAPAKTLYDHNVETLADALPLPERDAVLALMAIAPGLVKNPGYITMWRAKGSYTSPTEGMTAQEIATPRFTAAILHIAIEVATIAVDRVNSYGIPIPNVAHFTTATRQIRDHIIHTDLGTGLPLGSNRLVSPGTAEPRTARRHGSA